MFMKKVLKLSRMHMDHYIELIPDEVKCENYVHLRTIIGRLVLFGARTTNTQGQELKMHYEPSQSFKL